MTTLARRAAATVLALALLLWGADGLDAAGARGGLSYAALAVALVLAYYALTGRTFLPGRDDR